MIPLKTEYQNLIKLNIYRLATGESYTYKDLCEVLELPYPSSSYQKKNILNILNRLIIYVEEDIYCKILKNPFEGQTENYKMLFPAYSSEDPDEIEHWFLFNVDNNLKDNEEYTYKELCYLTSSEYKTGSYIKSFIKKLERCVLLKKVGSKYIVLKHYEEPLPPIGRALRSDAIYTKYIEYILLNYLYEYCDGFSATHPQAAWWYLLGIVNKKYIHYRSNGNYKVIIDHAKNNNKITLDKEIIEYFYYKTGMKFSKIFSSALFSLSKRRLIKYETVYVGIDKETGLRNILYNDSEQQEILALEREALTMNGCDSIDRVVRSEFLRRGYYKCLERLIKENTRWKNVYRNISIIYDEENIQRTLDRDREHLKSMVLEFNKVICESISGSMERAKIKSDIENRNYIELNELLGDDISFGKDEISYCDKQKLEMFSPAFIDKILFLNDELLKTSGIPFEFTGESVTAGIEKDGYFNYDDLYDYLSYDSDTYNE